MSQHLTFCFTDQQGPLLRLRFPAVACGTRQEAVQRNGEPSWTSQKLRECWDIHQTCLSMSRSGIFDSCEEGFVEMNGLEIRTITLGEPKADVQVGGCIVKSVDLLQRAS